MVRLTIFLAAFFGAVGVALGAYRAHGLKTTLLALELPSGEIATRLDNLGIAVQYDLIHAVAMLAIAAAQIQACSKYLSLAAGLFGLGTVLFCGTLAIQAITGQRLYWLLPPSGGVLLIAGWIAIAAYGISRRQVQKSYIPASL